MTLTIAIPHERRTDERRVALVPKLAERLVAHGAHIRVEAGAARSAGYYDAAWELPGVEVVEGFGALVRDADLVVKVAPPTLEEVSLLREGSVLVSLMSAFQHLDIVDALRRRSITTLAMDLVPRRTRARSMNAVASQGTVAGYKAALLAAELSPRLFPMLTTAAGTVKPALVVVIGAGVAGLQAIATVRRLGARVEAYDIRGAARERIESLGATMIDTGVVAEGADGLARALRVDERQRQEEILSEHLSKAHAVICAASIPGRPAPRIVSRQMVERMQLDTVLIDLAASTGGNCELTRPGEHVLHKDVLVVGPLNLPSHGAVDASEMYARNVVNFLDLVLLDGQIRLDPGDEIVSRTVLTHAGAVHHLSTAGSLGLPSVPFGETDRASSAATRNRRVSVESSDEIDGWLAERVDGVPVSVERTRSAAASATRAGSEDTGAAPVGSCRDVSSDGAENGTEEALAKYTAALPDRASVATVANIAGSSSRPSASVGDEAVQELDGSQGTVRDALPDDFTAIDGIGPALQGRLRDFGFRHYADLARLDTGQVERLTVQLELDDEIESGDWVGQSRRLMSELSAGGTTAGRTDHPEHGSADSSGNDAT